MLKLTITRSDVAMPPRPAMSDPGVEIWHDTNGGVFGYALSAGSLHTIVLPGLATYWFGHRPGEVMAVPERGADPNAISDWFRRAVLPAALQALGQESLHATAVLTPHGVVGLCGRSGAGKSTLAHALSRRGYRVWADDTLAFELTDNGARALPVPFRNRLRPPAMEFFGTPRMDVEVPPGPAPLARLCLLERLAPSPAGPPVELVRLSRGDAYAGVLRHVNCFTLRDAERNRTMIRCYVGLVARVSVFRLHFQPDFERLEAVVDALSHAFDQAPPCSAAAALVSAGME